MRRKILLQLLVPLLSLCVLFLLLIVDPVSHWEEKKEPLAISVLPRERDSRLWSVSRQGMEQAAADLGVELRFLRLGSGDRLTQQQELLRKEVAGGADAVILSPVDREGLGETLAELSHKPRIVTMETDLSKEGADACVQADNIALGETLGKAALNGVPEGGSVLLVNSVPGRNGITERTEAAAKRLEESQRRVQILEEQEENTLLQRLSSILAVDPPDAVIALDAAALELTADLLAEDAQRPLLYGCGSTGSIAAHLEQGDITAIAARNEFAAGYLAVEAAVSLLQGERPKDAALEFALVRKETMYDGNRQKLLFPVTW